VRALSPLATLERGYAVAQLPDGSVITSTGQVASDTEFTVRLADGSVGVRTLTIKTTPSTEEDHD
jgi:exodeoxyribonuclease VII large subunit